MGVTSCRFKSIFPSATAQRPKILHGYVLFTSRTTTPNSVESGRSFSSPSAPFCWKSTWTWSLTATEVLGATQLVTTWRKLLPTPIFQHHLATHRCGAQGQCQVNGPMCVVLSSPRTLVTNEDSPAWSFHWSPETLRPRDQSCHHEVWLHLDLVGIQFAHEPRENTSSGFSSKKGPVHTHPTRRKADMTMKATAHFHLCRRYENLCFHTQCV